MSTEFWQPWMDLAWLSLDHLLIIALTIMPLLGAVAYLTLMERKVLAAMQLRRGPNTVGPFGILQPLADGVKLLSKELLIPASAHRLLFLLAPMLTFTLALAAWAVIPVSSRGALADINVGILYLFAISSLGVYGIIIAGWASNNKYAFLGALRSAAQMISYEVSIGFILVTVLLVVGTMNLSEIIAWQGQHGWLLFSPLLPMAVLFFISALAETNRAPFDIPEGESEIVAGYFVEYSAIAFGLFFLGEYANMILMAGMVTILFLGGWMPIVDIPALSFVPDVVWFALKVTAVLFVFIWVRGTFPRFRYDQLMRLGWKVFLPLTLVYVVVVASVMHFYGHMPTLGIGQLPPALSMTAEISHAP